MINFLIRYDILAHTTTTCIATLYGFYIEQPAIAAAHIHLSDALYSIRISIRSDKQKTAISMHCLFIEMTVWFRYAKWLRYDMSLRFMMR